MVKNSPKMPSLKNEFLAIISSIAIRNWQTMMILIIRTYFADFSVGGTI